MLRKNEYESSFKLGIIGGFPKVILAPRKRPGMRFSDDGDMYWGLGALYSASTTAGKEHFDSWRYDITLKSVSRSLER